MGQIFQPAALRSAQVGQTGNRFGSACRHPLLAAERDDRLAGHERARDVGLVAVVGEPVVVAVVGVDALRRLDRRDRLASAQPSRVVASLRRRVRGSGDVVAGHEGTAVRRESPSPQPEPTGDDADNHLLPRARARRRCGSSTWTIPTVPAPRLGRHQAPAHRHLRLRLQAGLHGLGRGRSRPTTR